MKDGTPISRLPTVANVDGQEKLPCAYGNTTWAMTPNQLKNFIGAGGGGGGGGDSNSIWTQDIASDTWNVTHGLNKYPSITVVDSSGREIEGDVSYTSTSSVVLTFSQPFAGKAFLN